MFYVYTLSHNSIIFYVGQSKYLFDRYVAHMIKFFRQGGVLPQLDIIFHHKKQDIVSKYEKKNIRDLSSSGVKLYNAHGNKGKNRFKIPKSNYVYNMSMESRRCHHLYIKSLIVNYMVLNKIKFTRYSNSLRIDLQNNDFKPDPIELDIWKRKKYY